MVLTIWKDNRIENPGSVGEIFQVMGILEVYESLIWVDRYFEAGDFELYLPCTDEAVDLLREDRFITSNESEHIMIIEHVEIDDDAENGDKLIVKGRSAESILDRRIIKDPIDLTDASFPTAMYNLIATNIWAQMLDLAREIPELDTTITYDTPLTDPDDFKISCYLYGATVYEKLVEICKQLGIGFKITMINIATSPKLHLHFYYGLDLTDNPTRNPNEKIVVFSDAFDNLANSNYYLDKASFKNFVYIDGKYNEELTKATVPSANIPSGLNRRETYLDATNIPDTTSYTASVNVTLGSFTISVDNLDLLLSKTGYQLDTPLSFSYHSLWYYPSFAAGNGITLSDFGLSVTGTIANGDAFTVTISRAASGTESRISPSEYQNRIENEGNGTLIDSEYIEEFQGAIIPGIQWTYGDGENDDYYLGDIVTVRSQYGVVAYCRITEYTYSESPDEISELPTFEIVETNIGS